MSEPRVHLVFGTTGQVGYDLVRELAPLGRVIGLSRAEADLERLETVRDAIRLHRPAIIWNAAAATAVDALEDDPDLAFRVNATAPGVMAEEARRLGALLVHFSTDYVFDGRKADPYLEDDPPNPLNVYGRSKLAGEIGILQAGGQSLILRTSWVYSTRGRNFLRTMAHLGAREDSVRVVSDQVGSPSWSRQLARTCTLLRLRAGNPDSPAGIMHVTGAGACSRYQFACSIRDQLIEKGVSWKAVLVPVTTREYGSQAVRPANSVLGNDRLRRVLGHGLPAWQSSLREAAAEL